MLMALVIGAGVLYAGNAAAYSRIYDTETNNYTEKFDETLDGVVEAYERNSNQLRNENESTDSISNRLRIYWNKKLRDRESKYIYNQRNSLIGGKQSINVNDSSTLIDRSGEMQDREGVRETDEHRVEAVNATQIFRKRAKDYYVNGGYAIPTRETMSVGNVDGENNQGKTKWFFSPEYMMERGFINYVAKDPLRYLNTWQKEVGAGQQNMYNNPNQETLGLQRVGITPYTLPAN